MRLQTDLVLQQKKIEKLNERYNVNMFRTHVRREKPLEQNKKLEILKNYFFKANIYIKQVQQKY